MLFAGIGFFVGMNFNLHQTSSLNQNEKAVEENRKNRVEIVTHQSSNSNQRGCNTPQIYNFMKEFGNREGHLDVPKILKTDLAYGKGKVVVDIGLNDGLEFFASIDSGYSAYGFEANPVSAAVLRKKCEEYDGSNTTAPLKCTYVDAADIKGHLETRPFHSYLIGGGVGASRSALNMSISGPGSSFVEDAPNKRDNEYKMVTIIPVSDVVDVDVYLFKLDVQGYEFEVLKGAKSLFQNKTVKTMVMEVYPRGLGHAQVDFDEFLHFIWNDLGMFCSSSNPPGSKSFSTDHPNSMSDFANFLKGLTDATW